MVTNNFMQSETILVNGIRMNIRDYKKMKRVQAAEKLTTKQKNELNREKRETLQRRATSEIKINVADIKDMLKNVKGIVSLKCFYKNAPKNWGSIAKTILSNQYIERPYTKFYNAVGKVEETMKVLQQMAQRNEIKSSYQYFRTLSYQMMEVKESMDKLFKGIEKSKVITKYMFKEIINGKQRRLGLEILMQKGKQSYAEMDKIIQALQAKADVIKL